MFQLLRVQRLVTAVPVDGVAEGAVCYIISGWGVIKMLYNVI